MKKRKKRIVSIGTKTSHGNIQGILYIGERYYLTLKNGCVSLMPADVIEEL